MTSESIYSALVVDNIHKSRLKQEAVNFAEFNSAEALVQKTRRRSIVWTAGCSKETADSNNSLLSKLPAPKVENAEFTRENIFAGNTPWKKLMTQLQVKEARNSRQGREAQKRTILYSKCAEADIQYDAIIKRRGIGSLIRRGKIKRRQWRRMLSSVTDNNLFQIHKTHKRFYTSKWEIEQIEIVVEKKHSTIVCTFIIHESLWFLVMHL